MMNKKLIVLISEDIFRKDKTGVLRFLLKQNRHKIAQFIVSTKAGPQVAMDDLKEIYGVSRKKHYTGVITVKKTNYWKNVSALMEKSKATLFLNATEDHNPEFKDPNKCLKYISFLEKLHNRIKH